MIELPLKIPPGKQLENQRGRIYRSIQLQIRNLIKIWHLPEIFQVNVLSSQNPYVSLVQC